MSSPAGAAAFILLLRADLIHPETADRSDDPPLYIGGRR